MKKNLRWKIILVVVVIGLCLYLSYPPGEKIHLGLDLKGGMHLVLQVLTDDAINIETDQAILRLQEQLKKEEINFENITKGRLGEIILTSFDQEKEGQLRKIIDEYFRDWDSSFSGNKVTLKIKPGVATYLREQSVRQALETLRNRIDELGLTEPTIQRQGIAGDRIIVELPGVDNPERVKEIIKTTALLEWRLVIAGPAPDKETLLQKYGGELPPDLEILPGDPKRTQGGYYLVQRVSPVVGKDLRNARRSIDEWNNPAVAFTLSPDAGKRFYKFTSDHIGEPLAVVLDGKVQQVATIEDRIRDSGIIRGRFTQEEAEDIALVLRAGPLPATIKYLEERTIGPSLGADSIRKGLRATIIALLLVMGFMIFYYRVSGINAVVALILNIIILMGALSYFKATLTLPGIAGIILTIGMAVDANVLIFERIREELATGKNVLSAVSSGFSRAFRTILDANITTIIAAIFLFQFGTGAVKGFAVTLIIGITASMFTAVFVSRIIFDVYLGKKKKIKKLSI
ncbi:MAG: protein translocase subunit SecD [Candidatus Aminicenantes bacterium 4484_214]|nr:MAG: protein translocase subunit SecD [Candidatus Aminicenantes bacterium 4484_214]HDJ23232.1 protein translocase subunit SecD [Candidatus Aminicenantes bacterium]